MASSNSPGETLSASIMPLTTSSPPANNDAQPRPNSSSRPGTSSADAAPPAPPIFTLERVQMQFDLSADFVACAVANNVLILALQTNRILRIDLDAPDEIDDIDLPRRANEVGLIRRLFLDPTASHLLVSTTSGENYYLHSQSKTPKALGKLRGVHLESVAWNPSQPTASTREVLVGATDGAVYETYIDATAEFLRKEEKYAKLVYRVQGAVTGLWCEMMAGQRDVRRVMVATATRLLHFVGRLGRHGHEGSGSIYAKLFEGEVPAVKEIAVDAVRGGTSGFAVTPESPGSPVSDPAIDATGTERIFAWASAEGVLHGKLLTPSGGSQAQDVGKRIFEEASMLSTRSARHQRSPSGSRRGSSQPVSLASAMALTQWHILQLVDGHLTAHNRLDQSLVFDTVALEPGQRPIALLADLKKNTFWFFTSKDIWEIVVQDEDRDVWRVLLKDQKFEDAMQYANSASQKDAIATAHGDFLVDRSEYMNAAEVYGTSSKAFESVALKFVDQGQRDALRLYLSTKLSHLKKSQIMQRIMLAAWLTEIYMAKMNSLDDMTMTDAEMAEDQSTADIRREVAEIRREFQEFVRRYKGDLDRKTIYDIISSHGREDELLFFAVTTDDYNYVLSYWVQREKWSEALKALNRQTDPTLVYKYSSVLMVNEPVQLVDILMRQAENLDARKLIPGFLNYNQNTKVPLNQNQAIRYLVYEINNRGSTDAAIHNTLISLYASHPTKDESQLLGYLESQSRPALSSTNKTRVPYDADFALRLCIQHSRIRSCVHIYTTMRQFPSAVSLALAHGEIDLAISVADLPEHSQSLRKTLWLSIAKSVIASSTSSPSTADSLKQRPSHELKGLAVKPSDPASTSTPISLALSLIERAQPPGTLRIEDLLPLLPDFLQIDTLKSTITSALASYTRSIEALRADMDASAATADRLDADVASLGRRWVLITPGESCAVCGLVLIDRKFWCWACGHAAHWDCTRKVVEREGSKAVRRRVRELKAVLEGQGAGRSVSSQAAVASASSGGAGRRRRQEPERVR